MTFCAVRDRVLARLLLTSLVGNKAVVCALSASYVSTFAGYPVRARLESQCSISCNSQLDSIKSRLQTTKHKVTVPHLAALVYREEGLMGFYRGLWIPLMTISFVRASSGSSCLFYQGSSTHRCCKFYDIFPDKGVLFDP